MARGCQGRWSEGRRAAAGITGSRSKTRSRGERTTEEAPNRPNTETENGQETAKNAPKTPQVKTELKQNCQMDKEIK